jgi:hypothetical protein
METKCTLLLDYKLVFPKHGAKITRFAIMEVCAVNR